MEKRESVQVLYHGKLKGVIVPAGGAPIKTTAHAFFGSVSDKREVASVMALLRGGRYRDL